MVAIPSSRPLPRIRAWLKQLERAIKPGTEVVKRFLGRYVPEGLYPRSLIIVIAPMVLLQSIVVLIFMERHWEQVTEQLSRAVTRDISLLIELYEDYPHDDDYENLIEMARERLEMAVTILPGEDLPADQPRPFFRLLDRALSKEINERIDKPFWLDTLGKSGFVEIRIKVDDDAIFRVIARRSRTYASNSHIFILWMVGTSMLLITAAIIILRNQIRPIQRLAAAAEAFGLGREAGDFKPRGAAEVQRAARAFIRMRERIERQIEQRTTMLAGVSHDLRTLLTRFKLQLAFLGDGPEVKALASDVDEMQHMLEDYLAFARGDDGEAPSLTDVSKMMKDMGRDAEHLCDDVRVTVDEPLFATVRPNAFKRCIWNLVQNACRFGTTVHITADKSDGRLQISVEDDGPGIPEDMRTDVFRPFLRLDDARNQDTGGTGLGLAIARDITTGHGGDIDLGDSELGGLNAVVRVPA